MSSFKTYVDITEHGSEVRIQVTAADILLPKSVAGRATFLAFPLVRTLSMVRL